MIHYHDFRLFFSSSNEIYEKQLFFLFFSFLSNGTLVEQLFCCWCSIYEGRTKEKSAQIEKLDFFCSMKLLLIFCVHKFYGER